MYYQTTFIGLRERGSEGIACPKGGLSPLNGYPNIVHRPIGRFVVSGRGSQMIASSLVGSTIHQLFRHPTFACRVTLNKSQHVSRLRLLPAVEFLSEAKEAFACRSFSLIPVRSSVA